MALALLAVGTLGSRPFSPHVAAAPSRQAPTLLGTWRLIEFWDRVSATSPYVYRYGKSPTGYFTYDATGHVSIQIMRGPDPFRVESARGEQWFERASHEELRRAAEDYRAYFGTYVVDSARSLIMHRVEGDSRGLYTGTDQMRQYRLVGDTLFVGDNRTTHRVLVRVR